MSEGTGETLPASLLAPGEVATLRFSLAPDLAHARAYWEAVLPTPDGVSVSRVITHSDRGEALYTFQVKNTTNRPKATAVTFAARYQDQVLSVIVKPVVLISAPKPAANGPALAG